MAKHGRERKAKEAKHSRRQGQKLQSLPNIHHPPRRRRSHDEDERPHWALGPTQTTDLVCNDSIRCTSKKRPKFIRSTGTAILLTSARGWGGGRKLRPTRDSCCTGVIVLRCQGDERIRLTPHVAWIIAAAGTTGPTTTDPRFSVSSPSDWATYQPWSALRIPPIDHVPQKPALGLSRGSGSGWHEH